MKNPRPCLLFLTLVVLALAIPLSVSAQYMYLDANGDGVSTLDDQIQATGSTTLDVWLRTDRNRDGSAASCISADGDLTINSYEFILRATGGTVSWSQFVNHQPDFTVSLGQAESATDYHNGLGGGAILPPGTYRLASLTVTVALGTPSIQLVSSTSLSGGYLTSFGSRCSGTDFDNTLKLGTDWFDVDGAPYAGTQNAAPVLTPPSDMTVAEGGVAEQELTATDLEGSPVTFDLVSGPFYATVTTVDPGAGTGQGRIRLTPGLHDAGSSTAMVRASDGLLSDTESLDILVTDVNTAPVLSPIADVTMFETQLRDFFVTATDAEQDPLVLSFTAAPDYASITSTGYGVSRVALFPGHADAGEADATVRASDGVLTDEQTFHIVVNEVVPVHNEILCPLSEMLVPQGQVVEQQLHAVSPDGNPVQFHLVSGPSYVTVSTTSSDPSSATGLVRAAPGGSESGTATVEVAATDGIATDTRRFQISAGARATLPDPTKPLFQGETLSFPTGRTPQSVAAGDLDGDGILDLVTANLTGSVTILRGVGDGRFERRDDYPLPEEPYSVAIGDLNGDGRPDLAVADSARDVVSVLFAIGECQFGRRLDVETQLRPAHVKLADWTADGVLDMVVTDEGADLISVIRGHGDGSFFAEQHFPVGSDPCYSDDGDFNGDGHLDVVVANEESNTLSVLLGNGDGTFQPHTEYRVGDNPRSVEVGDLNGDGKLDLAAANFLGFTVSVLLGVGDGTFLPHTEYFCGLAPWSLALGDLNGDTILDVVTANVSESHTAVQLGTGAGAFLSPTPHPAGLFTRYVTLGDVNRDGALDVIAVNEGANTAVISLGKGDGGFVGPPTTPTQNNPGAVAVGDWNGDGVQDLAVGSYVPNESGTLRIFLGAGDGAFTPGQEVPEVTPTEIVSGDWDGDHVPDLAVWSPSPGRLSTLRGVGNGTFQAPVSHFLATGPGSIEPVEMTGDGVIDLAVLSGGAIFPVANDGNGSFTPLYDDTLTSGGEDLLGGDWNGDGRTDLAVSQQSPDQVRIFLRSDQGFTRLPPLPLTRHPIALAAGDFNEDQRLDLAVGTFLQFRTFPFITTESKVEVLSGRGDGTFDPLASVDVESMIASQIHVVDANGDANQDLVLNSGNLVSLLLGFGNGDFVSKRDFGSDVGGMAPADLNGDGRIDFAVAEFSMNRVASWINQGTFPVVANRAPTADAGGPYSGAVGAPVGFDGTGSSDPDGDALAMTWSFGDQVTAGGPTPVHTYQAAGVFTVTLTVSDGQASDQAGTTATIGATVEARAFTLPEDGSFRLFAGKPNLCVRLEPVDASFELSQIDLGTVTLRSVGTGSVEEIEAIVDKSTALLDRDRNGVAELKVCYALDDARLLFASVTGARDVPVSVEGTLADGRAFHAEVVLRVIGARGFPAAFVAPNPMNPSATLFVATSKPGRLLAALYDASGRRVRIIADLPMAAAGVHELTFDGRSDQGSGLASGIYFYRVESTEGTTRGRVAVVR